MRRFNLLNFFLILLIMVGLGWGAYQLIPKSTGGVFEIAAPAYGETTVTGIIQKDNKGNFLLYPSQGLPIRLDLKSLDPVVGYLVTVKGTLNPPSQSSESLMNVSEVTTN